MTRARDLADIADYNIDSNLDVTGTVTATTFQANAGGTFTTASGNDLNIVYPANRSLFIKEGTETHVTVDNTGNVGIGTASPSRQLEIYDDGTNGQAVLAITAQNTENSRIMFADPDDSNIGILDYNHSDDSMRFIVNNSERLRIISTGELLVGTTSDTMPAAAAAGQGIMAGSRAFIATETGGDTILGGTTGSNFTAIYQGGSERMRIDSSGKVGIGITSPVFSFDVRGDVAANYLAYFKNDGNNSNRYGVLIAAGQDSGSGTLIGFTDGNGDGVGGITFSGGTVTYGTFTAQHPCIIPDADNDPDSDSPAYPYGTLLETTSLSYTPKSDGTDSERGIRYHVRKTQTANSKAVLGAYGCSMNGGPENQTNEHQALVLGDGHILCNNSGGNIEMGDGICSSAVVGIGQKATASPSMIIGIAQEAVTFSSDTETKLVAVQYGLQQFTPW